jgi:hypothetical protein
MPLAPVPRTEHRLVIIAVALGHPAYFFCSTGIVVKMHVHVHVHVHVCVSIYIYMVSLPSPVPNSPTDRLSQVTRLTCPCAPRLRGTACPATRDSVLHTRNQALSLLIGGGALSGGGSFKGHSYLMESFSSSIPVLQNITQGKLFLLGGAYPLAAS